MNIAVLNLGQATTKNILHQKEMSESVVNSSNSSTQKIKKLIFQVGKKSVDLFAKYDTTNLWMAITNLLFSPVIRHTKLLKIQLYILIQLANLTFRIK